MMNVLMRSILLTLLPMLWAFPPQQQLSESQSERDYGCVSDSLYSPRHGSADLSSILDFELSLFRRFSGNNANRNFFFSPYSIWNALVMAYLGASGRTENQLKYALGLVDKDSTLKLLRQLQLTYKIRSIREKGSNILELVNRIYFDDSVTLRSCMEGILHSELYTTDFNKPVQASEEINAFVSEVTRGKISDIVDPLALNGILMAIVNAAYFKGAWKVPFDPEETKVKDFKPLKGKAIPVDMMSQLGEFRIVKDNTLQADVIEFPYVGESVVMYILKPTQEGQIPLEGLIGNLTKESLLTVRKALNGTIPRVGIFSLPRFQIETLIEDELKMVLENIGITDAFDPSMADFQDFSSNRFIHLGEGIHKAYLEVNEEGTEAAASTVFITTKIGFATFDCNRPFVFAIVDKETDNVLFIGSLLSPEPTTNKLQVNAETISQQKPQVKVNVQVKQQDQN